VKKQTYKYDPARLPYHPSEFEIELISPTFTNTVWDACTELTKQMDIMEISRTGQWAIKVDSLQDDNYIYIIPQMVSIGTVAFGDFEVGAGFIDLFTHPYGLMLWAKTLEDITSSEEESCCICRCQLISRLGEVREILCKQNLFLQGDNF
jgi:hypothetical protein